MTTKRLTLFILCLVLLGAWLAFRHKQSTERALLAPMEVESAAAACNSATGSASGNGVSGKVYVSGKVDGLASQEFLDWTTYLSQAQLVYGGYENFAESLSDASSVLCVDFTTSLVLECPYHGWKDYSRSNESFDITLRYNHTEARAKLLAWPSKELIAESTFKGADYAKQTCPERVTYAVQESRDYDYYEPVGLIHWLEQYVTITE